jgi:hypothetical protein
LSAIHKTMDLNKGTRHFFSIEMTNEDRLEAAALMDSMRDTGLVSANTNLGRFIKDCFYRGLNEYRKDLVRHD